MPRTSLSMLLQQVSTLVRLLQANVIGWNVSVSCASVLGNHTYLSLAEALLSD